MPTTARKQARKTRSRTARVRTFKTPDARTAIRHIGDEWARHWNEGDVDAVAATYAEDAVYLPPHHEAVHGRDAIRGYLVAPLTHGVSDLQFEVTYIKQQGPIAWDVGTYRMTIPQVDGSRKEDRGKYLSVWKRAGKTWQLMADAWSSDLPPQ